MPEPPDIPRHRSALSRATKSVPTGIAVELQINDIRALHPQWTYEEAWTFTSRHGHTLAAAAIAGALEAAKRIIEMEGHNHAC